jgi:hypothetical protein
LQGQGRSNRLIVEGHDDLFSVASLMGHHIDWPQDKYKAPVWIVLGNGATEILEDGFLKIHILDPEVKNLGVVFDADLNPTGRYASFRNRCDSFFTLPRDLPEQGLVVESASIGKRPGLWIMPDNKSDGILETFLKLLVPDADEPTWKYATQCVAEARNIGCKYRDTHIPKADLYTWLAWHDPPGQSPGVSLTKKVLDPHSPNAAVFVKWFRELYGL